MQTKSRNDLISSDKKPSMLRLPLDCDPQANLSPAKSQTPNPRGLTKQASGPFATTTAWIPDPLEQKSPPAKKELSLVDRMLQDLEVAAL